MLNETTSGALVKRSVSLLYFKTPKRGTAHLVVFAALLYGISTRTVVELLTELCVLPVVDGLTRRRWTTVIAR